MAYSYWFVAGVMVVGSSVLDHSVILCVQSMLTGLPWPMAATYILPVVGACCEAVELLGHWINVIK